MKNNNTILIAVLIILAVFLLSGFGFGMMGFGSYWMPHMDYGQWGAYWTSGFGWMALFMVLIWILVIVFLVLGILWLVKQLKK